MYETEQEQIEAIKAWFSRWGNYIIAAILAVIIGSGGAWFYQDQQQSAREEASNMYQQVLRSVGNNEVLSESQRADLDERFTALYEAHPNSTYTIYTALLQARYAAAAEDLEGAEERLRWALDQGLNTSLERTVNLRLARVLFAQGDHDAVLAQLDAVSAGSLQVGYDELRGDVYADLGEREQAREAYAAAWELAQSQGLNRPLLQVKAENYGVL